MNCMDTSALLLLLLLIASSSSALNYEGALLLSFKRSIYSDPLKALHSWRHDDSSPCSWNGVVCGAQSQVSELSLPNSRLHGSLNPGVFLLPQLRSLDLSNNMLTGELPEGPPPANLQLLNVSNNALAGALPESFFAGTGSLSVVSLASNIFSGPLPQNFTGRALRFLNVSCNKLSGSIPAGFAGEASVDAVLDFSYNNFTGNLPPSPVLLAQKRSSFTGNVWICGNSSDATCLTSSPALAAIPKTAAPSNASKFRPGTVTGIVAGDLAGVVILLAVLYRVYHARRQKTKQETDKELPVKNPSPSPCACWGALRTSRDQESTSTGSSEAGSTDSLTNITSASDRTGTLVTVDGLKELEMESLFKASACILGTSGSSILYKAMLQDGTTLAVRRIGEGHVESFSDFETQVRTISKLVHPNLVRVRGFYWGLEEKLLIYDFVPIGTLANMRRGVTWDARFKIAMGVARGVAFLHEKKHVHGNLKPSNILLEGNMEPRIGDFGLERCVIGETSGNCGSARAFGSSRSMAQAQQETGFGLSPSPSLINGLSPYQAPESLRALKAQAKWDVYSFGVILLEMLTGKIVVVDEMGDDGSRVLRMADVAIRADVEGREEGLIACFKLGFRCASPQPQKRPCIKEVVQILEQVPHHKCNDCK